MGNRHFTLVVAGNNPEGLLEPYDSNLVKAPYVVYKFSDAKKLHQQYIAYYEEMLKLEGLSENERYMAKITLDDYKDMDDIEFYTEITNDYVLDEETGNAMSTKNPNGMYNTHRVGKNLALPLITKNGEKVFAAKKKDIDWDKIHLSGQEAYAAAWDMVMGDKKPSNEYEENIYNNMKNRQAYFNLYGSRENYIASSTSFWGYAFLSENTGWVEIKDTPQFEWVMNFYDKFIKPLPDDELITIYECTRE